MENSKYYIPNLEDIKVGTTLYLPIIPSTDESIMEVLEETKTFYIKSFNFLTHFCLSQNSKTNIYNTGTYTIYNIDLSKYKCKYLDKEDIESLGWKQVNVDRIRYKIIGTERFTSGKYELYKYPQEYKYADIIILKQDTHRTPDENGEFRLRPIFEGTIKNKSELKILMKWLNII